MSDNGLDWLNFWGVTVLAVINLVIVIASLSGLSNSDAVLPLITLLMMVLVIWAASMTVRRVLREVSAQLDTPHLRRLRLNASVIAIAANCAIACTLPYVH